jgi:hypothetical protein
MGVSPLCQGAANPVGAHLAKNSVKGFKTLSHAGNALSSRRTVVLKPLSVKNSVATREIADLQAERRFRHLKRDPVFKLSGRSTSEFFGVIRVGRQYSVLPAHPGDPAV